MIRLSRAFVGLLVLLSSAAYGWAQGTAQINGTVADGSGGVLPGVTVVGIQTDTGFRREAVTDENGSYTLSNLPIGPYRLEASLAGFRSYAQTGIVLQVGSNPVLPVTLELGSLEETVSVEASAPLVETRSPSIGSVIENERIEALPLNGRNPTELIVLAGAAVDAGTATTSTPGSRGIAVAGGQSFGVAYMLDGAMHNNVLDGLNLPLPFPDALQEFRVETSAQNAQNGVHAGASVNAVTKSGTNVLRGDLFEFTRHHRFNSTNPFSAKDPTTGKRFGDGLVRNQFGGTLGGPVVRDKLFFFGAYQGTRGKETPASLVAFVPTAAMLAGDFTAFASAACNTRGNITLAAPFVNNRIDPALFSPAAVRVARELPAATDPCGRSTYSRPTNPTDSQWIGKADWQITQNHSLFGRYMATTFFSKPSYSGKGGNILSTTLGGRDNLTQSVALGDTLVLSNTVVNNVRVAYTRAHVSRSHTDFFGPQDIGVNAYSYLGHYMIIAVTGGFNIGTGTEAFATFKTDTYSVGDDLTIVRGNHQWGVGGSAAFSGWRNLNNVRSAGNFTFDGATTGLGLADFMVGRPFQFLQALPYVQDITQNYVGLYGQDTWRLSDTLTMNYGVRWEPWFPQQHHNNAIYNFSPERFKAGQKSTVFSQAPPGFTYPGDAGFAGKAGMETRWLNVNPRVGLSWDPTGDGRTSVRVGYGLNSDFVSGLFFFDSAQVPPFGLEQRLLRPGIGTFDDPFLGSGAPNPFPATLTANSPFPPSSPFIQTPSDRDNTRVHSWNTSVQRQIGANMAVSATYLGNRMLNLWGVVTGNPGTIPAGGSATGPCTLRTVTGSQTFANCSQAPLDTRREITQLDPAIGRLIGFLDYFTDYGWQQYHGLQLSFQKRAVNGFSTSLNYTWSTCEGLISQGQATSAVGSGYMLPVSLLNPPADANARLDSDKGPCTNSPTHIFNSTASVETPQFGNTAARLLASGWRLSGIFRASSGSALNITTGIDRALTGNTNVQRPNQVLDNPYGAKTVDNWFNAAAFAQPALGTYGTLGRNAYNGPGNRTVDLSLVRSFSFLNTHRLEARVEAFNAFNWFRWGNPVTAINNANFGRILTAGDPRVMQFAVKYQF